MAWIGGWQPLSEGQQGTCPQADTCQGDWSGQLLPGSRFLGGQSARSPALQEGCRQTGVHPGSCTRASLSLALVAVQGLALPCSPPLSALCAGGTAEAVSEAAGELFPTRPLGETASLIFQRLSWKVRLNTSPRDSGDALRPASANPSPRARRLEMQPKLLQLQNPKGT